MATSNIHEVIGKAILDENFRKALFANPKAACEGAGLPLQAHQYEQVANFDRDAFDMAVNDLGVSGDTAG